MKRFCAILTALLMLFLMMAGAACAEAEDENKFTAGGYTIWFEVVPQDQVEAVVGSLAQYAKTEGEDMEANRLLFIHYTKAEIDGKEVRMGSALISLSMGQARFNVDGTEYTQSSLLMNSGTQLFLTYLIVPAETADDAAVSISYLE